VSLIHIFLNIHEINIFLSNYKQNENNLIVFKTIVLFLTMNYLTTGVKAQTFYNKIQKIVKTT